jgi:hypothetical protein
MVGALGSLALASPRGPTVDIFYFDGGRFRISISTSQEGPSSMFFILMVGAPRSPLAPLGGPPSMFLSIDSGCCRISSSDTSHEGVVDIFLR